MLKTTNEVGGFEATFRGNTGCEPKVSQKMYDQIGQKLKKILDIDDKQVIKLLDSPLGRHIADAGDDEKTIITKFKKWMNSKTFIKGLDELLGIKVK